MENELRRNLLKALDCEIVNSYNKDKNQVLLKIHPRIFNRIARELD